MPRASEDNLEVQIAILNEQSRTNNRDHNDMITRLQTIQDDINSIRKEIQKVSEEKVNYVDFVWWRNLLVSGIMTAILITFIVDYFHR